MMSDSNEALEMLELTLIPGVLPPVYGIGLVASRITFADQQRRAINIIWALLREGRIHVGEKLAVIGGGIAGTTAAAYAIQQGLRVTVFETFADAFSFQQGSGRWIHPNVYDWPKDAWRDGETNLPCMNWRAGTAGDVVAQLRTQWNDLLKNSELCWLPNVTVADLLPDTGVKGLVRDSSGSIHGPYQCIVMAGGFGEEPENSTIGQKSYWRDDDLHQRIRTDATAFVSGCGDGGLIDTVRIAIRDFRHDWLQQVASMAARDQHLVQELMRIEHDTPTYPDGAGLTTATQDVAVPDNVLEDIRTRIRPNTKVILNGRLDGPLTRRACMLNRFLTAQLIKLGAVSYSQGILNPSSIQRVGSRYQFEVNGNSMNADEVVIRHGPAKRSLASFTRYDDALKPIRGFLMTYSAGVDRTRRRLWGPLPKGGAPTAGALLPLTLDVLKYWAEVVRGEIQQELLRLKKTATVAYKCCNRGLEFEIRNAANIHSIHISLSADTQFSIIYERATGEKREQAIDLAANAMTDTGTAGAMLGGELPKSIEWLTEEKL